MVVLDLPGKRTKFFQILGGNPAGTSDFPQARETLPNSNKLARRCGDIRRSTEEIARTLPPKPSKLLCRGRLRAQLNCPPSHVHVIQRGMPALEDFMVRPWKDLRLCNADVASMPHVIPSDDCIGDWCGSTSIRRHTGVDMRKMVNDWSCNRSKSRKDRPIGRIMRDESCGFESVLSRTICRKDQRKQGMKLKQLMRAQTFARPPLGSFELHKQCQTLTPLVRGQCRPAYPRYRGEVHAHSWVLYFALDGDSQPHRALQRIADKYSMGFIQESNCR